MLAFFVGVVFSTNVFAQTKPDSTLAYITELSYTPISQTALKFTGKISGLYDLKSLQISAEKLFTKVGPKESPILKNVTLTKDGATGEPDEFEVVLQDLQPASYNYIFFDRNHAYINGSSGYFGIEEQKSLNQVTITDIAEYYDGAVITGKLNSGKSDGININFGTSPELLNVTHDTVPAYKESEFTFDTRKLKSDTFYYYQIVDKDDKPISLVGTFRTTLPSGESESKDVDIKGADKSLAPKIWEMFYTPGVVSFVNTPSVTQTTATISGVYRISKLPYKIYIFQTDGPDYLSYTPTINSKNRTFSDVIKKLAPGHLYMVYAGNPNDDTNNYTPPSYFSTLPVTISPGQSAISSDMASIVVYGSEGIESLTIEYGEDEGNLDTEVGMNPDSSGTWIGELDGLTPDTHYLYRIRIQSTGLDDLPTYSPLYEFVTGTSSGDAGTVPYIVGPSGSTVKSFEYEEGGGIIPCSGVNTAGTRTTCKFEHLIKLINNVINFLMFALAPGIAALMMLYGGVTLLTSGGSPEKMGEAKSMFVKAFTGLVIAFAAWIIVKMVMIGMGYNVSYFPTFF